MSCINKYKEPALTHLNYSFTVLKFILWLLIASMFIFYNLRNTFGDIKGLTIETLSKRIEFYK